MTSIRRDPLYVALRHAQRRCATVRVHAGGAHATGVVTYLTERSVTLRTTHDGKEHVFLLGGGDVDRVELWMHGARPFLRRLRRRYPDEVTP